MANGALSKREAVEVYNRTLANVSDPAQRAAALRIVEAIAANVDPDAAT